MTLPLPYWLWLLVSPQLGCELITYLRVVENIGVSIKVDNPSSKVIRTEKNSGRIPQTRVEMEILFEYLRDGDSLILTRSRESAPGQSNAVSNEPLSIDRDGVVLHELKCTSRDRGR